MFLHLLNMSIFGVFSNFSLLSLLLSVIKNLQSSKVLLLQWPQFILFLLQLLLLLFAWDLLISFIQYGLLLLIVKSLKVVGLYSMSCKLRLSCHGVFCHEIVLKSETNFMVFLVKPVLLLLQISVSFLLCLQAQNINYLQFIK